MILATDVEPEGRAELETLEDVKITDEPLEAVRGDLAGVEVLCVSVHDTVDETVLDAAPDLELVVTRSTGIDNVDVEACQARGILAHHLPEYATDAVAEMTVASATLALRNGPRGWHRTRSGRWDRSGLMSRRLVDATIGVVGVGRIGREVARRCTGLGADVLGYDVAPDPAFQPDGFVWTASIEQVLERADVATVHVDLNPSSRGLIGSEELALLPDDAILINTSRGEVVDTEALVQALEAGELGGAVLDVLEGEPEPPLLERLVDHPGVLVTPHLAGYDRRTFRDRYRLAADVICKHR